MKLCAAFLAVLLSGCVTSTVMQLASMEGPPSHQADRLLAAYQLADGNIVLFVKGRIHGIKGDSEFSLLVPRAQLDKLKTEHAATRSEARRYDYYAVIGPSLEYKSDGWHPLPIRREVAAVSPYALPAESEAMLYEFPRAPNASNGKSLRKDWGNVELVYVEPYPDQGSLRTAIVPNAQRVKGHASKWLPAAVAADLVTLPAQAMWSALFVVSMAGVASTESQVSTK